MNEPTSDKPMNKTFAEFDEEPPRPMKIADGNYVEPTIESAKKETAAENETKSIAADDSDGMAEEKKARRPKTLVLISVLGAFIALLVLSKIWRENARLGEFIVTGNETTPTEKILSRLNALQGEKMSDVSLSDIEDTLKALPFVRDAIATKEYPSAIRVEIVERVPAAIAVIDGTLRIIDGEGYALNAELSMLDDKRLPLLVGAEKLRRAQNGLRRLDSAEVWNALQLLKEIRKRETAKMFISEVRIERPKRLYALAPDANTKFIFGEGGDYARKLRYLDAFWKQVIVKKGLKNFEYVDLRFDGKIFAK